MTRLDCIWIGAMAVAMELVTCFFRFGMNLRSTHDIAWIARFTFGIRIHHGYVGVLMIVLGLTLMNGVVRTWAVRIGTALVLSDLIHHFLVLWPIVGSPEFDLVYPERKP